MEINIRECRIEDAQSIYILNRDEMGYDYPPGKTREKLCRLIESDSDRIFVAVADGDVVGYIHANDYDVIYAPHMKNIMGIAVLSSYRKCGIGRALIGAVEQWAHDTGAQAVRLTSGESRTGAHEFYRCCGYVSKKKQLNFSKEV